MAVKKTANKSKSRSSTGGEVAALLAKEIPKLVVQQKFVNHSFSINGKVFAFSQGHEAVALKLPASRVLALMEVRGAVQLIMGKRIMREWVVVTKTGSWRGEIGLIREAQTFVTKT